MKNKLTGGKVVFVTLLILFSLSFVYSFTNVSFVSDNTSTLDYVFHEPFNSSTANPTLVYGSNSFHDFSILNGNARLQFCDDNLSINDDVDLRYYTESYNLTKSVLYYKPLVISRTNTSTGVGNETTWCASVDVKLASTLALYPGFLSLYVNNVSVIPYLNQTLNGSFNVGVSVKSTPKRYLFNPGDVYAHDETTLITTNADQVMTSLVSANGTVLVEDQVRPNEPIIYFGELFGGEKVITNGITSLEIKIYNPCTPINESGYYILNNTNISKIRNVTETCVTIENISNVVLNFGDDYIDGDNETNGSLSGGRCAVLVENSRNIAFEHYQTQEFHYGICIRNSTVNLFGDGTTYNVIGAHITDGSVVDFEDLSFSNADAEIQVFNDSLVSFTNVNLATAALNSDFYNVIVKSVRDEPPLPGPDANGTDIDQFVEIGATQSGSWAQINFIYPEPLPNGLAIDDVSILKYNGTYELRNITTISLINGTNVSNTTEKVEWGDGNWTQLFTLVAPQTKEIIAPNQTSFSVFAPFAYEINITKPDPTPQPDPDPDPEPVGSSGGGSSSGAPQGISEDISALLLAIELNLTFDGPVTLEQGEPSLIPFVLNNTGNITADDITIVPNIPDDWETVPVSILQLFGGQSLADGILIAPHEKTVAKEYKIPVDVFVKDGLYKVTTEILTINVVPANDLRRLRVVEYPPVIQMAPNEQLNVSFLVANVGSNDLVDIQLQFSENTCLRNVNGANDITVDETKLFRYNFFSNQPGECDIELTFYEDDVLVGFVPLTLQIQTEVGSQSQNKTYLLLILLAVWTIITFIVIGRKRQQPVVTNDEGVHEL